MTEHVDIVHIFTSPGHNFVGHYGGPSGDHEAIAHESVELIAGRGIRGDRYAEREEGHPKQITFFDMDVIDALRDAFEVDCEASVVRRNVFVRGLDLPTLIGRRFRIGDVEFEGTQDCRPCFWMDEAVAPGAEAFLEGKGGLRAAILSDGTLSVGQATFTLIEES